ncbi:MAG: putative lipid II flippase FtsW [Deltaproteobacteria bacterium]|nr:putative lipid II flippase FtsW [Deltaproteobacteria bacterium]
MSSAARSLVRKTLSARAHPSTAGILVPVMSLFVIGMVMVFSASSIRAKELFGDEFYYLTRQGIGAAIGCAMAGIAVAVPPARWSRLAPVLYAAALIMLVLVLHPSIGVAANGARRWFRFMGFGFQPSEFAKLALILLLARGLSSIDDRVRSFTGGFLPPLLLALVPLALIMAQPDLGTAVVIGTVACGMLFVAGAHPLHLGGLVLAGAGAVAAVIAVTPWRVQRVIAFLDPWENSRDSGFQLVQSLIAFAKGGILGVGLGDSRQKLHFLPEAHTDFIFSVLAEEMGFLGVIFVISLFLALVISGLRIASKAETRFEMLAAAGISMLIAVEAFFNLAVVMGLAPTKGLPLPFFSVGATSLVIHFWLVGILISIARRTPA